MDEYRFAPVRLPSRPRQGPHSHVIRVGANDRYTVTVCNDEADWFAGHWLDGYTVRCIGKDKGCTGCKDGLPTRGKGYLTVCLRNSRKPQLLELTPGAGDYLEEAFPEGTSLRGAIILVFRSRATLKSPLFIERVGTCENPHELPPPIDPRPTLMRLWKEPS